MKGSSRIWFFIRKSLLGGLTILLPISIIVFFFKWIYQTVTELIAPFTSVFIIPPTTFMNTSWSPTWIPP